MKRIFCIDYGRQSFRISQRLIQLRNMYLYSNNTHQNSTERFKLNPNQTDWVIPGKITPDAGAQRVKFTGGASGYNSLSTPLLVNGEFMESDKVGISVWDETVQRGYGVFSVIPISQNKDNGKLVASGIDLHLERLFNHAKILMMNIQVDPETVHDWVYKLAHKLEVECIIRVMVTQGATAQSICLGENASYSQVAPPNIYMLWYPKVPSDTATLKTFTNPWHPVTVQEYPAMKWLSYAPNIFFIKKANEKGFNNALFVSSDQYVLEGPIFSIGWFKEGELYTPSVRQNAILPSTTMAMVTTIAFESGIRVNVGKFKLEELLTADEVFISGLHDLSPVTSIDQTCYKTHHLTNNLDKKLKERVQQKESWVQSLCSSYDFM